MNLHDWSRVADGTFHHFHAAWIYRLADALNEDRLPPGFFALAEQHLGRKIADVLLLHASDPEKSPCLPPLTGDWAVALADHYVELPLAATYAAVISAMPRERREVIEQTLNPPPSGS